MNKQRVNCDFPVFTLQGWLLHWLCSHPVRTACVFLSSHQHCSPWLLLPREYNRVYDFVLFLCVLGHTYMLLQCKARQIYVLIAQIAHVRLSPCMSLFYFSQNTQFIQSLSKTTDCADECSDLVLTVLPTAIIATLKSIDRVQSVSTTQQVSCTEWFSIYNLWNNLQRT